MEVTPYLGKELGENRAWSPSEVSDLDAWAARFLGSPPSPVDVKGPSTWTAKSLGAPSPLFCHKVRDMVWHLQSLFAPEVSANESKIYHLFPVGSFGLGLFCEGDELDCLLIGNTRESRLRELLWQRITEVNTDHPIHGPLTIVPTELTPNGFVVLVDNEVVFRISYLRASLDAQHGLRPFQGSSPDRVEAYRRNLDQMDRLATQMEANSTQRVCYYFLRRWAERIGLYGKLGHLTSYNLALLAPYISERTLDSRKWDGPEDELFWHKFMGPRQALANFLQLKLSELYTAVVETFPSPVSSRNFCEIIEKVAGGPFTSRFDSDKYVKITVSYSGNSRIKGSEMISHIEGWMPRLFLTLEASFPGAVFRIWPNRLVKEGRNEDLPNSHWEGCWIIATPVLHDEIGPTIRAIREWIEVVKGDANDSYSSSIRSLYAFMFSKAYMEGLSLVNDTRKWPRPVLQLLPEDPPSAKGPQDDRPPQLPPPQTSQPGSNGVDDSSGSKRLRPALDVLNRLVHDPAIDLDDYVIGYEDRHANANYEKPAGSWVTEVTAEDFIPQSRIRYFRRISDGAWVWDRKRKMDLVFT